MLKLSDQAYAKLVVRVLIEPPFLTIASSILGSVGPNTTVIAVLNVYYVWININPKSRQTVVFWKHHRTFINFKGCGIMGPWLVLVSPCFRENVVATCKIGSFLCSLDNLLQKNVIVLFFGNQISKWRSSEKGATFDLLFTFFVTRKKLQKFLQHISHSHTYTYFAHPINFFCLTNFEKKKVRIYQIRFLFGMNPGVNSYSRHFGTINK